MKVFNNRNLWLAHRSLVTSVRVSNRLEINRIQESDLRELSRLSVC
jgi:hypothetical protein